MAATRDLYRRRLMRPGNRQVEVEGGSRERRRELFRQIVHAREIVEAVPRGDRLWADDWAHEHERVGQLGFSAV